MRYVQAHDGDWLAPTNPKTHRMMCCDCGLVHDVEFRVKKGRVQYSARRNKRATAAARRRKQVVKV